MGHGFAMASDGGGGPSQGVCLRLSFGSGKGGVGSWQRSGELEAVATSLEMGLRGSERRFLNTGALEQSSSDSGCGSRMGCPKMGLPWKLEPRTKGYILTRPRLGFRFLGPGEVLQNGGSLGAAKAREREKLPRTPGRQCQACLRGQWVFASDDPEPPVAFAEEGRSGFEPLAQNQNQGR